MPDPDQYEFDFGQSQNYSVKSSLGATLINTGPVNGSLSIGSFTTSVGHSLPAMSVSNGKVTVNGDLIVDGKSMTSLLQAIEQRLALLLPDPEKHEKFSALKRAYEHYKMMEALCYNGDTK